MKCQVASSPTLLLIVLGFSALAFCEEAETISACQLNNDPASFNHKLVRVTSFVSHGFEDFGLLDPSCDSSPDIWLEYGGKVASGTVYCCGPSIERTRPAPLEVEGISIPFVEDENFRRFDTFLQVPGKYAMVHATIVGRFFAGKKTTYPDGKIRWVGYGHLGCCSLLVIEQVVSVDPHNRDDLDYEAYPDQPDLKKCGYRNLAPLQPYRDMLRAQQEAEAGERDWSFDDPQRVAVEGLAGLLKIAPESITAINQSKRAPGKMIYTWRPRGERVRYMLVVSRPYWLSFYSHKQGKVAWVLAAAYEECYS